MSAVEAAFREAVWSALQSQAVRELLRELVREELRANGAPAEYLSIKRAAEVAGVAEGTIRRWIREGRLEGHRAGRVLRIKPAVLEAFLSASRRPEQKLSPEELADRDFG